MLMGGLYGRMLQVEEHNADVREDLWKCVICTPEPGSKGSMHASMPAGKLNFFKSGRVAQHRVAGSLARPHNCVFDGSGRIRLFMGKCTC